MVYMDLDLALQSKFGLDRRCRTCNQYFNEKDFEDHEEKCIKDPLSLFIRSPAVIPRWWTTTYRTKHYERKRMKKLPLYVCTVCGKFKSRTRKEVIMHMSRHEPEVLRRLNLDLVLETARW